MLRWQICHPFRLAKGTAGHRSIHWRVQVDHGGATAKPVLCEAPRENPRYRSNVVRIANAVLDGDRVVCSLDDSEARAQIFAARTRPVASGKFKKRAGARKVKDFERAQAMADGSLTPESATLYRATSARGNYLSQDRPDLSYSTKELCRDFSVPNQVSFGKLKRLGRYCVGRPRLVYHFAFQDNPGYIDSC